MNYTNTSINTIIVEICRLILHEIQRRPAPKPFKQVQMLQQINIACFHILKTTQTLQIV